MPGSSSFGPGITSVYTEVSTSPSASLHLVALKVVGWPGADGADATLASSPSTLPKKASKSDQSYGTSAPAVAVSSMVKPSLIIPQPLAFKAAPTFMVQTAYRI